MRCSARILGTDTFSRLLDQIGRAHVRTPLTPRSTLFPYTTLFRSRIIIANGSLTLGNSWRNDALLGAYPGNRHIFAPSRPDRESTRPNSTHTEIYTLSLHDALPISDNNRKRKPHARQQLAKRCAARRVSWEPTHFRAFSTRSGEHTSELHSHRDLHSFPTRRSSDLG